MPDWARDGSAASARLTADSDSMAALVRSVFGTDRRLDRLDRLRGGSKKGVYRLGLDDGSTAIAYVWDDSENYWSHLDGDDDRSDPFSAASGLDLFSASHERLGSAGLRVPELYLLDSSRSQYRFDVAVVEDIRGGTLEALLRDRPTARAQRVLGRFASELERMHAVRAGRFGKVAHVTAGGTGKGTCEQIVLARAEADLAEAALRVERVAGVRVELDDLLGRLAGAVRPRREYTLIHGELGPDHALVDDEDRPVLIDIEGLMFFDLEWEHAFLRMRFGADYQALGREGLDQDRLRFYTLALHLSLVSGPLRLLDGDFPHREAMLGIVEHNLEQALAFPRR